MGIALITGSAGLIGSQAARFFSERGLDVVGIDNDLRSYFFGVAGSTQRSRQRLELEVRRYRHIDADIRDHAAMEAIFAAHSGDVKVIIHTAAQPLHDWAAREPLADFTINANGTLGLLELARRHCAEAPFIFLSTNKVYGDAPNRLPLIETETRWELAPDHPFAEHGIDESMSIDQTLHSLFGASKAAADLLVQEYGRYFGMYTACFRGGCLTGPAHAGTELHGFLAYLVKCAMNNTPYTVFGYQAKQVRDNIHSYDLVNALWHFFERPRQGEVYNIGGGRFSNCSMLEAISTCERLTGHTMNWTYSEQHRKGDHVWWISDYRKFRSHYQNWEPRYSVEAIIKEIYEEIRERDGRVTTTSVER
jgi:CDP-paratose 2-epimerase